MSFYDKRSYPSPRLRQTGCQSQEPTLLACHLGPAKEAGKVAAEEEKVTGLSLQQLAAAAQARGRASMAKELARVSPAIHGPAASANRSIRGSPARAGRASSATIATEKVTMHATVLREHPVPTRVLIARVADQRKAKARASETYQLEE